MIMKLAKLLCAGNSFFGGNREIAYRLNKFCLPKFNEGKNPFAPQAEAGGPAAQQPPTPVPAKAEKNIPPPKLFPPVGWTPKPLPVAAAKPVRAGWTAKLNPFRAPAPGASPNAVQPEFSLSLDNVKVVHNDLADVDVDIVPVKSHAGPAAPVLPPARRAWEYLGESVLRS